MKCFVFNNLTFWIKALEYSSGQLRWGLWGNQSHLLERRKYEIEMSVVVWEAFLQC